MKRITLFLLGIVLMSTVACGRTNSNANSDRVTAEFVHSNLQTVVTLLMKYLRKL